MLVLGAAPAEGEQFAGVDFRDRVPDARWPTRAQDSVRDEEEEPPAGRSSTSCDPIAAFQLQRLAYVAALANSMPTKGSSPTTRASCPGGIVYDSPPVMVILVPSVIQVSSWPETQ